MKLSYKNNFKGYFLFYYRIIGNKLFVYIALSILISFLDGIGLAMFIPLLQNVGSNGATDSGSDSLGYLQHFIDIIERSGIELTITSILLLLSGLFMLKGVIRFIQLEYYALLRQTFLKKVRNNLIKNLQGLSYSAFLQLDAGKIQNTLTTEVNRLFITMSNYFNATQNFVMLLTYMTLAFLSNYQFAILVGVGSLLSNFIYKVIYAKTQRTSIKISEKGNNFNGFLIQAVHQFKYLKSTNTFASFSQKLKQVIEHTEILNRKMGTLKAVAISIREPIIITIVSIVILLQVHWFGAGLDSILLSLLLFFRALTSLVSLQSDWQGFIENIGGMYTVSSMSDQMSGLQEKQGTTEINKIKKGIYFNDVVFNYDNKRALNSINMVFPAKKTVALIGESGSGKTTIANMVAGLLTPDTGQILIDDVPIQQYNLEGYRNKIGYISQESVIFSDNIYNNITFWADPTPENVKRFEEVLKMASLTDFVNSLPEKEQTKLGDNGLLISGGQKQRISIARELFKQTEILIFDEATSALDSETEKIIQQNIEDLHGNYTMILIAHRLSTIREADIIYLLEEGKVSASGSFDEMISKSNRFRKMVTLQAVS